MIKFRLEKRLFCLKIVKFGMSEKVGPLSFQTPEQGELAIDKPYSEQTAQLIDQEVRELVGGALTRTRNLLREHQNDIEKVRCEFIKMIIKMNRRQFYF